MSMGKRPSDEQGEMWVATGSLARSPGHPFYARLNEVLAAEGFDPFVESLCAEYYEEKKGRPSIPPGVYFRLLLIGYFERIDSERGIAWRCADSLSLRTFLGIALDERTPDHSTMSRIRTRLPLEVHGEVFGKILTILGHHKLIHGKTVGVDATTLESNAALRSIVRRDTGEGYNEFLEGLAKASGIETPTRQDLAKLDRKRTQKGSNDDWFNPHDPDAEITKMKDGSTHLAHKDEHAVDLDTGAVLAVTIHGGAEGDTRSVTRTLAKAEENIETVREDAEAKKYLHEDAPCEVVTDKGYHGNDALVEMHRREYRTYVSEPDRGRRKWKGKPKEQKAVYANRRRIRGERGKRLMRKRGELLERPFAHYLEAGGMRRTHLRRHENILKRLLIHVAGFNLGLLMRTLLGAGTPKEFGELVRDTIVALWRHWKTSPPFSARPCPLRETFWPLMTSRTIRANVSIAAA